MKLSQILSQVKADYQLQNGLNADFVDVEDIALDSRLTKRNSAFFALPGKETDGSDFIQSAIKNGASITISSTSGDGLIKSSNPFGLLVDFLKIFYAPLPTNIYAITGTNGKTSTAEFTRQILDILGKRSASIGTLGVTCDAAIQAQLHNSSLTTPDIVSLYKNLHILKQNGIDDVAIEVSSIGLEQSRAAGLKFAAGAFTNFTKDHLDYHKSMEEYLRCKTLIFSQSTSAVLNSDIPEFDKMREICDAKNLKIITYGRKANDLKFKQEGVFEFRGKEYEFKLSASGEFQQFNALCALANVLSTNDLEESELRDLLNKFPLLNPAPGRMQLAGTTKNHAKIYIDFAHTPDALTNVLKLAKNLSKARVLVLFGCGGDRDKTKRSEMAKIACDLADFIIVTDDNPRTENPAEIRAEILKNCDSEKTIEVNNRKDAIEKSITLLKADDILILAGKGHEKYQIIDTKKTDFDEEKIVQDFLKSHLSD